jgi:hypothetical protein
MTTAVRRGVARAQPAAAMAKSPIRRSPGLGFSFRWRTKMERVVAKLDGEEREKMAAAARQGAAMASPCSRWRRRRARRRWEMRPAKWKWEWGVGASRPRGLRRRGAHGRREPLGHCMLRPPADHFQIEAFPGV